MRLSSPHPQLRLEQGCVVSYCATASAIGSRVLREGGNAVDAAVATALALAVTYPQAGNLGGGGFMLISRGAEVHALDYRETAPRAASPELFVEPEHSVLGARAVGVPGTVAGLAAALERFGTFAWDRLLSSAIELAEHGVWLTNRQAGYLELHQPSLARFPSTRHCFLVDGRSPLPGTLFRQPDLARTLRRLADDGPQAFYRGEIGTRLVDEIARGGGVLSAEDLAGYQPVWRTPYRRQVLGREVFTAPLPSAGGLVVQLCLALAEAAGAAALKPASLERQLLLARCFRLAYAVRRQLAGDPDRLTADERAEVVAWAERKVQTGDLERLENEWLQPGPPPLAADERGQRANTTHFCVLDGAGNAVSNTYSLNTMFGAKLVVDGAGFLLNNCLDDFRIAADAGNWYELVQGERNQLRTGARPASSMTPTLVRAGDRVELIIGGSGGPRIPTSVVQVLLAVLADGERLDEAIRAPRIHHQYVPAQLAVERHLPVERVAQLSAIGPVERLPLLGICAAIRRDPTTDEISAMLDPRFSFE